MKKILEYLKKIELNYSILSCLLIILAVHFISAGYSSFNTTIRINDLSAKVRADFIIRVTNFKIKEASASSISYYEEYDVNLLYTRVFLPTLDSYVIYDVDVVNYSFEEAGIQKIILENEYLDYEIINHDLKDFICDNENKEKCTEGAKKTFGIKIKYKDGVESPKDAQELKLDIWFSFVVNANYYGIDSTNLKNKFLYGTEFTEKINIPEENLKVIMGWRELSLNIDDSATYIDGVLNIKEAYGDLHIYNFKLPDIKVESRYKANSENELEYVYEITNNNPYEMYYSIYSGDGKLSPTTSINETLGANETVTKTHMFNVNSYGECTLRYSFNQPFYIQTNVKINVPNINLKFLRTEVGYTNNDTAFLYGPIKRSEIESVSFTGETSIPETALGSFDVSYEAGSKLTWAWYFDTDNNGLYEVYLGYFGEVEEGERAVYLNRADCLFASMTKLNTVNFLDENGINRVNTDECVSLFRLFFRSSNIKKIDLSSFNTINNISLYETFDGCYNVEEINLGNMDTSKVIDMWRTFCYCYKLKEIDVSRFNTSSATTMGEMFRECRTIKSLDLSNFNTSNVNNLSSFLEGCYNLTDIDLSTLDTSNVEIYSNAFKNVYHLNTTITVKSNNFTYTNTPFNNTSTDGTSTLIINYTAENKEKVEEMVNSKSSNSNVILGQEVI